MRRDREDNQEKYKLEVVATGNKYNEQRGATVTFSQSEGSRNKQASVRAAGH